MKPKRERRLKTHYFTTRVIFTDALTQREALQAFSAAMARVDSGTYRSVDEKTKAIYSRLGVFKAARIIPDQAARHWRGQ